MTFNSLQIKIKNFKSIAETDWIHLDGKIEVLGKNLIDGGSNGSGKSSIIEALYVAVSLCDLSEKGDVQRDLKKFNRDLKYPFEILVQFSVKNKKFEVLATPEGIKKGSVEAKQHLYKLITSFLLQGMSNSLIMQDASDCKSIISSYFECDLIIQNIMQNVSIVRGKLEDRIQTLNDQLSNIEKSIDKTQYSIYLDETNLQRLIDEESELTSIMESEEGTYNEQDHQQLLNDIDAIDNIVDRLDQEISHLYQDKDALSNGIDARIKELKKQKDKCIEDSIGLYSRTIGNKFTSFVKKKVREYNEDQKKENEIKNQTTIEEKNRRIEEINRRLGEISKQESPKRLVTDIQRMSILKHTKIFTDIVTRSNSTVVVIREKTSDLYNGVLNSLKTDTDEIKDKLQKELSSIKKSPVKGFKEVDVAVFTLKNKPKRNLPQNFIVYTCNAEEKQPRIIENHSFLDTERLEQILNEVDEYQLPDTSEIDNEIAELETTDIAARLKVINQKIANKQSEKVSKAERQRELREKERQNQAQKIKFDLLNKERDKLGSIRSEILMLKTRINEGKSKLELAHDLMKKTRQGIDRWNAFLAEINKDARLVQNSFKDYIIDMYNDRIEPLISFYSSNIFTLNSKLLVKIGSKTKQPTLNGIKFDYTSGGEKSKALFIFSLAHRDYLSKQRGFCNDYIFCDEVFDGMDEIGRYQSIRFLTQAIDMRNILIISHMEEKTLPGFNKITLIKSDKGSIIEQAAAIKT